MWNNLKRPVSPERGNNDMSKRRADISTPPPSCSTPSNCSKTYIENDRQPILNMNGYNLMENTPVLFVNNSPLHVEELLLYVMMTLVFPVSPFVKTYAPNKYDTMIRVMYHITGVKYNNQSIRNYFNRVSKNKVKGVGKTQGMCRWAYYRRNIQLFVEQHKHLLNPALQGEQLDETTANTLVNELKAPCAQAQHSKTPVASSNCESECGLDEKFDVNYVNQMFETTIKPKLSKTWSKYFNTDRNTLQFYQFGECPGYAEKELEIIAAGT